MWTLSVKLDMFKAKVIFQTSKGHKSCMDQGQVIYLVNWSRTTRAQNDLRMEIVKQPACQQNRKCVMSEKTPLRFWHLLIMKGVFRSFTHFSVNKYLHLSTKTEVSSMGLKLYGIFLVFQKYTQRHYRLNFQIK